MAESVIAKTTGDSGIASLVESFAAMGAPWLSGVHDAQSLAREMGLNLVENFTTSELYQVYWPGRPLTSPIFNFYSIYAGTLALICCALRNPGAPVTHSRSCRWLGRHPGRCAAGGGLVRLAG